MASDPQTWAELKSSVERWLIRDDQVNRVPEYIALAERRFNRDIFSLEREETTTLSTTAESVALPADFWGVKAMWLDTDPKVVLDQMSLNELRQKYSAAATGQPGNYAISNSDSGGDVVVFGPSPDSTYTAYLTYWQTIPALGSSQATNWLLTAHPDLYLCASLVEGFLALRNLEQANIWEQRTQAKIDAVNGAGRRKFNSGAPLRIRSAVVV